MAWFTFTDVSNEVSVFRLRGAEAIAHARGLLDGTQTEEPHIAGTVIKTQAGYNIGWSYHLDPASLFFFEFSAEVGDSTMRYIEDHLAEVGGALLPGSVWTGWSSVLLNELNVESGGSSGDVIIGSVHADILFGRAGSDALVARRGDDHLVAGTGCDGAFGGRGNDKLSGGAGDDALWGGKGDDVLVGEEGDDRLHGGSGTDTLLIAPGSGEDVIFNFTDTNGFEDDVIDLRPYGFTGKAEVARHVSGDDLVLDLGGGDTLRIVDYLKSHAPSQIGNDLLI